MAVARNLAALATSPCALSVGSCSWVWHAGLLYIVPPTAALGPEMPVTLTVSNRVRHGTEFAITQGDNQTLSGAVFTAFLSHGHGTQGLGYAYAVVACRTPEDVQSTLQTFGAVKLVSNTQPVQAVCATGTQCEEHIHGHRVPIPRRQDEQ